MADEHRGGLLYVVAARMEKRVEGELRAIVEIITLAAPRYSLAVGKRDFGRVHTNRSWRLFVEGSYKAIISLIAHDTACFCYEISG